ncbi:MAG: peroxidase [Flavobacteriales bacterium CG_4_9_14_0_2_um_filter_35_242]|nr:peroxidase-related enzyme [Zetaproteobacteria bacterium]NDK17416.1 peroxidase-related enzyme [Flavobacteriales bacterium]OIO11996.1 MAG: peroxidase [Flavobacteriaceae bacterium CG1_02_35_72]PIR13458.1 MAG: peroxidase [Flavobacteriales bacterium CG11_big_fil_rev_8_21_14_0_20_35_7]PIX05772.1 MAG: peroxidase [Flavobacteriales bacterium CG_4_8_14_3_um_filter_35_10]PJA06076.1 MAG: peroxidase [Flavobacteriales bacterium CG_4_10_14_0_2_um_filter_35_18]PJC58566.1 MAG: peroxidase [Flavobacteriales 
MSRIKVIQQQEATGRLKEIYDEIIQKRGQLAEVHKIQSLRPESIIKHIDLYMEIMFSKSDLSRAEREMMAVVTSVSNQCFYCQIHHSQALNNYWKDDDRVQKLRTNYLDAGLNDRQLALCEFAKKLTLNTNEFKESATIDNLKKIGFSDAAILDATLVVAYFNFVNRMVLSLGVNLEANEGKGYNY